MSLIQCKKHGLSPVHHVCQHIQKYFDSSTSDIEMISIVDNDMSFKGNEARIYYCKKCAQKFNLTNNQIINGLHSNNIRFNDMLDIVMAICNKCNKIK